MNRHTTPEIDKIDIMISTRAKRRNFENIKQITSKLINWSQEFFKREIKAAFTMALKAHCALPQFFVTNTSLQFISGYKTSLLIIFCV